jgi:tellurite resistance protein TerC
MDWIVFVAVGILALGLDLALSNKTTARGAFLWSAIWITFALAFGGWIFANRGADDAFTYFTAYALEKSLSVDNLFVFILVFSLTGIPAAQQQRALFWGVVGALAMRGVLIAVGIEILERFHWVVYPFAGLLVYGAIRMLHGIEEQSREIEAQCTICTSWVARFVPITPVLHGNRFFVREGGRHVATPLFVALAVIETSDIVLAMDSIPAALSITRDPLLVYTSNAFALLGLRSLYFVVGRAATLLRFLRPGLAFILALAAAKLAFGAWIEIPPGLFLGVILLVLATSAIASLLFPRCPDLSRRT